MSRLAQDWLSNKDLESLRSETRAAGLPRTGARRDGPQQG